jgi:hypothetical protein
MACTTHSVDLGRSLDRRAPAATRVGATLAKLARRVSGSLAARGQKEIDRGFAYILARSGGHITDSMEREMMRKVLEPGPGLLP